MNAAARIIALVVPVIGLGALWALSDYESRQGTEWDVEIRGYDPRDLLRGHYVEFTYDWDGIEPEEQIEREFGSRPPLDRFCLTGMPPGPPVVSEVNGDIGDCEYPVEVDWDGVYGDQSLERGRLYVGQERALAIQETMRDRDQRAIVRVRLGENRRLTPLDITFRPLTAQELAERDAELVEPAEAVELELPEE